MTKWKKGAKDFQVVMNDDGRGSRYCRIPKPIDEYLGNPNSLKFSIKNGKIQLVSGED